MQKVSVVLPTYKEAKNLPIQISRIIEKFDTILEELIVVDDNSQDGTEEIMGRLSSLDKRIKLITRINERGIGTAIARGYSEAKGDILFSIDADLSMDLNDVPKMLQKLDEGFDICVGSRYIKEGQNRKEALLAKLASIIGNIIFKQVFKLPIRDVSMNFRVLKRSIWEDIKTTESSNVMLLEMLVNAKNKGYKITEIPTIFKERIHGESKTDIWKLIPLYIKYIFKRR